MSGERWRIWIGGGAGEVWKMKRRWWGRGGVVGERRKRRKGGLDMEDVATRVEVLVMATSR